MNIMTLHRRAIARGALREASPRARPARKPRLESLEGRTLLSADPVLDTANFNPPNGYVQIDNPGFSYDYATGVAVQPDGKILWGMAGAGVTYAVFRNDPNGSLDSTFGTNGRVGVTIGMGDSTGDLKCRDFALFVPLVVLALFLREELRRQSVAARSPAWLLKLTSPPPAPPPKFLRILNLFGFSQLSMIDT
jgi:hypothetical protein